MLAATGEDCDASRRDVGAKKACKTQREQTESKWLKELEAALLIEENDSFCQALIDLRKKSVAITKAKAGQRVRTLEEQEAAYAAQAGARNSTVLEHAGRVIDPATLLRSVGEKSLSSLKAFRKQGRLARWHAASNAAAGSQIADDAVTVQAGEVWLALGSEKASVARVVLCVVWGAYHRFKGGLRPETDPKRPLALEEVETIQLLLFEKEVSATSE
eukprot:3995227-Prymnesium_polylepis.1